MGEVKIQYKNLVEMLEDSVQKYADRPLYGTKRGGEYAWTSYREFGQLVEQFRGGLASLGVEPGDKVAVISRNTLQWAVGAYATYGLGAQYVPMYETQLLREWEFITQNCGARVLLTANSEIYEQTQHFPEQIISMRHVVLLEGSGAEQTFDRLCVAGEQAPVASSSPELESPMGMIYTSGTTGDPKGVVLSHKNMIVEIAAGIPLLRKGWKPAEMRTLCFLPWAHIFGQVVEVHGLLQEGGSAALVEDVNTLVDELALVQPTVLFAVPRVYNRIHERLQGQMKEKPGFIQSLFYGGLRRAKLEREGQLLGGMDRLLLGLARKLVFKKVQQRFGGNLRMAVSGASALSPEVAEFVNDLGIDVYEGYGLSENTAALTLNYKGHRKFGSVGKPIPGVRIKIDKSVEGSKAGDGEVVAYGEVIMLGYHNLPELTAATITEDGGLHTGDLGHFDEDGYLYITGRIKEQFKLENGKYVAPAPLEESLKLSPFINQILVTGLNRPHTVALIVVEMTTVEDFAVSASITGSGGALLQDSRIRERFQQELTRYGANYTSLEQPKNFALLSEEWSIDNGLLTPTLKLKRNIVEEQFQTQIDALYG
ncbi:MAG: long-chain fatty acid--CoA ligase [Deltaproteobacteria bacterium]|nr:long-chain fatty acid--CoA ligase [Deltaproteobacteria bacterium]